MDIARAAAALSRPGIDPRDFVRLAIAEAVAVGSDGIHVDVTQIPDGAPEIVTLSPPYAGAGYGLHFPIELDEQLVIGVPSGAPNAGGRIVGRTWDTAYPPPSEVTDNPEDVVLVVKPKQSIRIIVSGGGNALIEARDGAEIQLADNLGGTLSKVQTLEDGTLFMNALTAAIAALTAGNPLGAAALAGLQTALQTLNWPLGSTVAKASAIAVVAAP